MATVAAKQKSIIGNTKGRPWHNLSSSNIDIPTWFNHCASKHSSKQWVGNFAMGLLAPNKLEELTVFSVTGWHNNRKSEVWVGSQADISFARKIIAYEVQAFGNSLQDLEARLDRDSADYKKVENSKQRTIFELDIEQVNQQPHIGFAELPNLPRKSNITSVEGSFVKWLDQTYPAGSLLIATEGATKAYLTPLDREGLDLAVHLVLDGEGQIEPSSSLRPSRYRTSKDSLAQWIASTQPSERAHVIGYALGPKADAVSVELLRFRLHPTQFVALLDKAPAATMLLNEWDGDIKRTAAGVLIFDNPGSRFLDPIQKPEVDCSVVDWPKISVVTVSYNQAVFLEDCICSVLDQAYPNLEYIVVDAMSTDGSEEILRRYEGQFTKLIIEKDNGQSDGLNKGFDLATGDILTWINSDDMLAPGSLKRAALAFMQYDCDLVVGGCERITTNSHEVTQLHHPALPFARKVPLGFAEHLIWSKSWAEGDYFYQPEVLFSAEIWRRSGGYLKNHLYWAMDWELWIRMGMAGATIVHLPETIGRSREHPDQKTTSAELYLYQLKNILIEHDEVLEKLESLVNELPPGKVPGWPPNEAPTMWEIAYKNTINSSSLERTITNLARYRRPENLKRSIRRRMANLKKYLKKLEKYRQPGRLKSSIRRRLSKLLDSGSLPHNEHDKPTHQYRLEAERQIESLQDQVANLTARDRELSDATMSSFKKVQSHADAIADYASQLLFGEAATSEQQEFVFREFQAGTSIEGILGAMAIERSSALNADTIVDDKYQPGKTIHFPDRQQLVNNLSRLVVVDVGTKEFQLSTHSCAELVECWPSLVVSFSHLNNTILHESNAKSPSGITISDVRTFAGLVEDGEPAPACGNAEQASLPVLQANGATGHWSSTETARPEAVEAHVVAIKALDRALADTPVSESWIDLLIIDDWENSRAVLDGGTEALKKTLCCQIKVDFAEMNVGGHPFGIIDKQMRKSGFSFAGMMQFDRISNRESGSPSRRNFNSGQIMSADCLYLRNLDQAQINDKAIYLRSAIILHEVYRKFDLSAAMLQSGGYRDLWEQYEI